MHKWLLPVVYLWHFFKLLAFSHVEYERELELFIAFYAQSS